MSEDKGVILLIAEVILAIIVIIFNICLRKYVQALSDRKQDYENKYDWAWAIFKEPEYRFYFAGCVLLTALVVIVTILIMKEFKRVILMIVIVLFVNYTILYFLLTMFFGTLVVILFLTLLSALLGKGYIL